MATDSGGARGGALRGWLRRLVSGRDDPRIRATYRVLLAMPVFRVLAGGVPFVPAPATAETASLLAVSRSLPASVAVLGEYGFPKVVLAYLLLLAFLAWRHGGVPVEADLARWRRPSTHTGRCNDLPVVASGVGDDR